MSRPDVKAVAAPWGCSRAGGIRMRADDVKVGAIGPVAMQGVPFAKGAQAAIRSINVNGGVNDKNIAAMVEDYGYQIPRAVAAYKKLKGAGVGAIRGSAVEIPK